MFRSITCSLRSVACLLTALFLCQTINANAQSTDRFIKIDKSMLETMINSGTFDYELPFLIVAEDEGMMMLSEFNRTSTSILAKAVTLLDGYAEADMDYKSYVYELYYLGKSKRYDGWEFNLYNPIKYELGTSTNKFIFSTQANTTFTLIFDDTDESRLQIKSQYYTNGIHYNINYIGSGDDEGFKLTDDETKNLSLYCIDYMNASSVEHSDNGSDITITFNPHKDFRYKSYINYILNDGSKVSMSDLISSTHSQSINWSDYKSGPLEISLPNYDPEANTLWTLLTLPQTSGGTNIPFGPIFRATYSDISTGLTAPVVTDTEVATPVYHTLQGIRVSEPSAPGVYLCRRGAEVTKIIVR